MTKRRQSKLRILGVDRALMMLCKDLRRRCFQYRPEIKDILKESICTVCAKKVPEIQADHIEPVGARPHFIQDFPEYWNRMMFLPMQGLCPVHHKIKTKFDREKRKQI